VEGENGVSSPMEKACVLTMARLPFFWELCSHKGVTTKGGGAICMTNLIRLYSSASYHWY
jgi:hypothetical protein